MNDVIEFAQKLIKIPSVSGNREELIHVFSEIKNYFKEYNVFIKEFDFDEDKNAPALLISNTDSMNLDALALVHIDVVPESEAGQYNPKIEGNKLFGRGACDMKSQAAIVLKNIKNVIDEKLPINYGVLCVSDEETKSNSIRMFLKKCPDLKVDVLLDVDGGSLNRMIYQYKHPVTVKMWYEGIEAHSSRIWFGDNSINGLMNALSLISENFIDYNNKGEPTNTWIDTMSVTDFKTDFKANNVIPAYSEARISFRLTEKMPFDKLVNILNNVCDKTNAKFEIMGHSKGLFMDKDNPIIHRYKSIVEEETGSHVELSHMHGATDSRFFSDSKGYKNEKTTIIVHSINGDNVHGKGEYCLVDSVYKLLEIQKKFLKTIAMT